jgi:heat shock protein HtpX
LRNLLQSVVLIGGMTLLLALGSRLLFGPDAWWGYLLGVPVMLLILPRVPQQWLLQLYQAQALQPHQAPQLFAILEELVRRADLPHLPRLYWIPSQAMNAFAVGTRANASLALTQGLLERLAPRELAGVLAHEISHIRNNDLRIMALADLITRLTHALALTAGLLILLSLPLALVGQASISLGGLLLLILLPSFNALLQLGLSRVREFDADLDAARLTQDPAGLASALARIEQVQVNWWQRIMLPGYREPQPSVLRSHPSTKERVTRLLQLRGQSDYDWNNNPHAPFINPFQRAVLRRPRHRFFSGTWR